MFDYRGNTDTCLYTITDEACCYLIMLSRCYNIKLYVRLQKYCTRYLLLALFDDDNTIQYAAIQNHIADRLGVTILYMS